MYIILFEDDTKFEGGTVTQSNWNNMPDKKIKVLNWNVSDTTTFKFSGFEQYNYIYEQTSLVGQCNMVSQVIFMGMREDYVYQLIFDVKRQAFRKTVTRRYEEYRGKALTGWKNGVEGEPLIEQITKTSEDLKT